MREHHEWREAIPAYVASSLDPDERRLMESHLSACDLCADAVTAWSDIVAGMRQAGSEIFSPHPDPASIRRFSVEARDDGGHVARHVAACAACELEVAAWKIRYATGPSRTDDAPRLQMLRPWRRWPLALATAAGLLLGGALSLYFRPGPVPPSPSVREVSAALPSWSGPVTLIVLPSPRRGQSSPPSHRIDPGSPGVVIAVQPVLQDKPPDAILRFELRRSDDTLAWSTEMRADQIRRQVLENEVVTLALPSAALPPGRYELRLLPPDEVTSLLQVTFEIAP